MVGCFWFGFCLCSAVLRTLKSAPRVDHGQAAAGPGGDDPDANWLVPASLPVKWDPPAAPARPGAQASAGEAGCRMVGKALLDGVKVDAS